MVGLEKFWYGFGFVGNMLYMMQQIAPGKFKMTHYAFATAFMNLVLFMPRRAASGRRMTSPSTPITSSFCCQKLWSSINPDPVKLRRLMASSKVRALFLDALDLDCVLFQLMRMHGFAGDKPG